MIIGSFIIVDVETSQQFAQKIEFNPGLDVNIGHNGMNVLGIGHCNSAGVIMMARPGRAAFQSEEFTDWCT